MSDATLIALCAGIPLCGVVMVIDRLIKVLTSGNVVIKNHILITIKHPKDVTVTLESKSKEEINHGKA